MTPTPSNFTIKLLFLFVFLLALGAPKSFAANSYNPSASVNCQREYNPIAEAKRLCENFNLFFKLPEAKAPASTCLKFYQAITESLADSCLYKSELEKLNAELSVKAANVAPGANTTLSGSGDINERAFSFAAYWKAKMQGHKETLPVVYSRYENEIHKLKKFAGKQIEQELLFCGRAGYPPSSQFFVLAGSAKVELEINYGKVKPLVDQLFDHTQRVEVTLGELAFNSKERAKSVNSLGNPDLSPVGKDPLAEEGLDPAGYAGENIVGTIPEAAAEAVGESIGGATGKEFFPLGVGIGLNVAHRLAHRKLDALGIVALGTKVLLETVAVPAATAATGPIGGYATLVGIDLIVSQSERFLRELVSRAEIEKFQKMADISQKNPKADSAQLAQLTHDAKQDGIRCAP